jgi:UBX domain-containing protein 7
MEEAIINFVDITGATPQVAQGFLDMTDGDTPQAIQLYFENPELQQSFNSVSASAPPVPSNTRPAAAPASRPNVGREDARGIIHIDSDDDDDTNMTFDDDDDLDIPDEDGDDTLNAVGVARAAQEDEDAAMARRLQEELYSGAGGGAAADGIRSPIARTTETLIAPSAPWGTTGTLHAPLEDDELDAAIIEQMRRRRQPPQGK